jgi:hypothetical protein
MHPPETTKANIFETIFDFLGKLKRYISVSWNLCISVPSARKFHIKKSAPKKGSYRKNIAENYPNQDKLRYLRRQITEFSYGKENLQSQRAYGSPLSKDQNVSSGHSESGF